MSLESRISYELNKHPGIKRAVKRVYQRVSCALAPKMTSEGTIERLSPATPPREYFFGYYDKSPWDASGRFVLCHAADDTWSDVSPVEKADILLIDTSLPDADPARVRKIAESSSWNVQQGCMLQWLGPDFSSRILYNDCRDGKYVSVIRDMLSGAETLLPAPAYTVSADGKTALTLDFSRLYNLRPGYGYRNCPEATEGVALPDATAIWKIDIPSASVSPLLSYKDFASFHPRPEMLAPGAVHKVNHLMLSPDGRRFMVLYRWFVGPRKYTRLITCNTDGSDMFLLADDDMVSHCFWKDDSTILAFENKRPGGTGYYLMKDRSEEYRRCWPALAGDGHPSYSPAGTGIVTDSYPGRTRIQSVFFMQDEDSPPVALARVFAPFKYDNDTRCDLHPRWNRDGTKIAFDAVFEGRRGLYAVAPPSLRPSAAPHKKPDRDHLPLVSCVIPSYKRCDTVTRAIDSVLAQTYPNLEVCLVDDNEPGDEFSAALRHALEKYAGDSRVRYITQPKHINGAAARNAGIKAARGEFIAFLDDDDEWLPAKIEKQMDVIFAQPDTDAVTTLWTRMKNGVGILHCPPYSCENFQYKVFAREIAVFSSSILIRKAAIAKFGGFDETLSRHQDLQFLVDAAQNSRFQVVGEYLVNLHVDSAINRLDVAKLIEAKKHFFASTRNVFEQFPRSSRRRIRNAHNFEIVLVALRAKRFFVAARYLLKVGFDIPSYLALLRRMKARR